MSVPTTNCVENMLTNGEAEVVDSVVSHIPTSVAASEPCIPAVWKNSKQTSASDSELAKQIMARPQVSHSPYVPGQLERHLEFMHFKSSQQTFNTEMPLFRKFPEFEKFESEFQKICVSLCIDYFTICGDMGGSGSAQFSARLFYGRMVPLRFCSRHQSLLHFPNP